MVSFFPTFSIDGTLPVTYTLIVDRSASMKVQHYLLSIVSNSSIVSEQMLCHLACVSLCYRVLALHVHAER